MRIKTKDDIIVHVNKTQRSITIEGVEYSGACRALVSDNKDGTGTITLIFDGTII